MQFAQCRRGCETQRVRKRSIRYHLLMSPRKPKRYKLCHGAGPDDLSFRVSAALSEGWELYGEPFMAAFPSAEDNGTAAVYCQAVIHARQRSTDREWESE